MSVILPTFNRAATLPRAIGSVLRQTYGDFELIVVDDGSTDGTGEVIDSYSGDARVRALMLAHRGASAARNAGVAAARGRYVAFQDDDDEWLPSHLEQSVAALEAAGPAFGLCYSDVIYITRDGAEVRVRMPRVRPGVVFSDERKKYEVEGLCMQTTVIRREYLDRVGPFDEELPRLIDLDLFIRLAMECAFVHVKKPTVRYYANDGISSNAEALVIARRRLASKYRSQVRRHHLAHQYLATAAAIARAEGRRYREALPWALKALAIAPMRGDCRREALGYFFWAGMRMARWCGLSPGRDGASLLPAPGGRPLEQGGRPR